jgi:hypothetical protein
MATVNDNMCSLIDRFSLGEKIVMRTGWFGFMAVGTAGIYVQAPLWALVYVIFGAAGFALVVLPGLCAHCPYPAQHDTCLFLPAKLVQRFYPYKGPRMQPAAKMAVALVMAGFVMFPQFWLIRRPVVLMLFWVLVLPVLAAFPLYYCRRCRHGGCPMNRVRAIPKWRS